MGKQQKLFTVDCLWRAIDNVAIDNVAIDNVAIDNVAIDNVAISTEQLQILLKWALIPTRPNHLQL